MPAQAIRIEATNKALSALGGLYLFDQLMSQLGLERLVTQHLPTNKIATKSTPFEKFKALCLGFIAGADCLDSMERLGADEAFSAINPNACAANTYGNYLRAFKAWEVKKLNCQLMAVSLMLRKALRPKCEDFILAIDSTDNEQHGEKMEGLAFNYKNTWGLDTLCAFDQYGFQYWMDVRPGNTYTANGAPEAIGQIFKRLPRKMRRYLRADSGYCNVDMFNACFQANAEFVITMRANMFNPLIGRVRKWHKANHVKFHDGRDTEIGQTVYWPKGGNKMVRVVMLRAVKEGEQQTSLFNDAGYDYVAWATSIGEHEMTNEKIIAFYRGRANCENFVKELKGGFDLAHYPCQSLTANKAYGMIAAFAYTLMRYAGYLTSPARPHFSKAVRFLMINLPCQVVKHARTIIFRFNKNAHKEVLRWKDIITSQFGFGSS